uniref:FYR N-terminal domain-containing protein n=1 Tax=Macrostomum lignano TaxID=282301 RepID=A0A1I8FLE6_9PLAT
MTKMKKKFTRGEATTFISRKQALKAAAALAERLPPPVHPEGRLPAGAGQQAPRVNKGSSTPKVSSATSGHAEAARHQGSPEEGKRAKERGEMHTVDRLQRISPPTPWTTSSGSATRHFEDAVRDLDDCLCLCFLFSRLPKERGVPVEQIRLSARLTVQFPALGHRRPGPLRKVFVSIKGYYFEADVNNGVSVVWSVPHQLGLHDPADFYTTTAGVSTTGCTAVLGLAYPPALANEVDPSDYCQTGEAHEEFMASLNQPLLSRRGGEAEGNPAEPDDFPDEEAEGAEAASAARRKARAQQRLFNGCRFFLNRETPGRFSALLSTGRSATAGCPPGLLGVRLREQRLAAAHRRLRARPASAASPQPVRAYSADDADGGDEAAQLPYSATRSRAARPRGAPATVRCPLNWRRRTDDEAEDAAKREAAAADAAQVGKQQKKQKKPSVVAEGTQRRQAGGGRGAPAPEMMLPKKHKQLYKKMVFSRKRQARESAQLAEKKQKRQRTA